MKKLLLCSVLGLSACIAMSKPSLTPQLPRSVLPYTFTINFANMDGEGSGSGISVISKSNYTLILTCYHVIDGEKSVIVELPNNKHISAKVVAGDEKADLALLRVEVPLPIAPRYSDDLIQGEEVVVSGSPLDHGPMLSEGFIGPKDYDGTQTTTATAWPGNSGGGAWVMRDNTWVFAGVMDTVAMFPIQTPASQHTHYFQLVGGVSFFITEPIIEKFLRKSGY